eukprot:613926-Pyramimonas_sp.AAC.1
MLEGCVCVDVRGVWVRQQSLIDILFPDVHLERGVGAAAKPHRHPLPRRAPCEGCECSSKASSTSSSPMCTLRGVWVRQQSIIDILFLDVHLEVGLDMEI